MTRVGNTEDEDHDEDSQGILAVYHQRNQLIKPPNPDILSSHALMLDKSHGGPNECHHPSDESCGCCPPADDSCSHGTSHVPSAEVTHECHCPAGESCVCGSSQVPAASCGAYGGPNGHHCPSDESHGRHPPADNSHGHGTSHVPSAEVTHERRHPAGESRGESHVCGSSQVPLASHGAYGGPNGCHHPSNESRGHRPPADDTCSHGTAEVTHECCHPAGKSHVHSSSQACTASYDALDVNPEASDNEEDGDSSNGSVKITHTARNSKHRGEAKPSQLGFYAGPWIDILIIARNNYRKLIHTVDPFPERNTDSLKDAHNILLEAIAEYKDYGGKVDEGLSDSPHSFLKLANNVLAVYNANSAVMTAYICNL